MMRGFCRIVAAAKGFDVGVDYMKSAPDAPR
jgi:hypothetical protein